MLMVATIRRTNTSVDISTLVTGWVTVVITMFVVGKTSVVTEQFATAVTPSGVTQTAPLKRLSIATKLLLLHNSPA